MTASDNPVRRSVIAGCGSALPVRVMTNADMSKVVDTSDEWIIERTGIAARHIANDSETTRTLGADAARRALDHAGMTAAEIDLVIVATSTPDQTFPATATLIQADLGIRRGAAFDLQAVCSGFVYALATADAMLKTGQANNVLVIGSETFSRILDWTHRTTCVLFGDGAGAVVLLPRAEPGILSSHLNFGQPNRGWDFRSPGHGDVNFEEIIRELNRIGYNGPLSVEWEDCGMDRDYGAKDACAFVRSTDFAPSTIAFDAAFEH